MAKGQIGGNQAELWLEKGDPAGGEIVITAILSTRSGDPVSGATILFFVNGEQVAEQETDENGRASATIPMQENTFSVSAQIRGTALTERIQVSVKGKSTIVKNFDARVVTVDSEKGWERISIRVTPPKRAHFRITDATGTVHDGVTDEHGFALFPQDPAVFQHTKKMKYVVEVEGIEKQEEFPLEAPPAHPLPDPPPNDLKFVAKWWWRLRKNNNWRLLSAWIVVVIWLIGNLYFFGVGPSSEHNPKEWTRYQKMSDAEKFFYENRHRREGTPLPEKPGVGITFRTWLRSWSWWLWFWGLGASIIYIPIAFRDEFSRAWYKARQTVRERREGVTRGELKEQTPVMVGEKGEQQAYHGRPLWVDTLREFFNEVLAEITVHGIARRFR